MRFTNKVCCYVKSQQVSLGSTRDGNVIRNLYSLAIYLTICDGKSPFFPKQFTVGVLNSLLNRCLALSRWWCPALRMSAIHLSPIWWCPALRMSFFTCLRLLVTDSRFLLLRCLFPGFSSCVSHPGKWCPAVRMSSLCFHLAPIICLLPSVSRFICLPTHLSSIIGLP